MVALRRHQQAVHGGSVVSTRPRAERARQTRHSRCTRPRPGRTLRSRCWATSRFRTGATAGNWASSASLCARGDSGNADVRRHRAINICARRRLRDQCCDDPERRHDPADRRGQQYLSLAVAPTSAVNILEVEAAAYLACSGAADYDLWRYSETQAASAVAAVQKSMNANDQTGLPYGIGPEQNATTSTTFSARAGITQTTYFSSYGAARKDGRRDGCYMQINEIFI